MRKRVIFLLTMIICIFLCSCNATKTTDNHIFKNASENDSEYILASIQIDDGYIDNILCIQNDNIVYSRYEEQDTGTVLAFYRYNINENLTYKIGAIKHPYINSGDIVAVDDKIFFYCNVVTSDSSNSEMKIESSLYQINISENTLQKVAVDYAEQTLIYLDVVDDSIISFKGKLDGSRGITYLDRIDVSTGENVEFETLIYKEYDGAEEEGDVIYHFSVYDSMIYIMVEFINAANDTLWTIEKYSCDGNYIDSVRLNNKITSLISGERISKFEIFGEYGFIRTFSGRGVLFNILSDEISPILLSETDLDIAIPTDKVIDKYAVMYSRDIGDIWRLDIENSSLYKLDLSYEHLNYVYLSKDNKVLISSDEIMYGELDQISKENENLLVH